MGIETPSEYSGSGCGFLTMMLVVEELARVDASVAAYVDIHNTLVNSLFMKLGTEEQKQKYLTKLCTEYVSKKNEFISKSIYNNIFMMKLKFR